MEFLSAALSISLFAITSVLSIICSELIKIRKALEKKVG
mgnify:CR=1 FL=1